MMIGSWLMSSCWNPAPPPELVAFANLVDRWRVEAGIEWLMDTMAFSRIGILGWQLGGCAILAHSIAAVLRRWGHEASVVELGTYRNYRRRTGWDSFHEMARVFMNGRWWYLDFSASPRTPRRLLDKHVITEDEVRRKYPEYGRVFIGVSPPVGMGPRSVRASAIRSSGSGIPCPMWAVRDVSKSIEKYVMSAPTEEDYFASLKEEEDEFAQEMGFLDHSDYIEWMKADCPKVWRGESMEDEEDEEEDEEDEEGDEDEDWNDF